MDYTTSNANVTHVGTGHRMHQASAPVRTAWSDQDANSVIWSLMEVLNAAGVAGATFNAADPNTYNRLVAAIRGLAYVPGELRAFAMATVPSGWLECNGAVVSRTTYAALFAAVGTTYNTGGEASTDFRLPDLRGEFLRGWDHGRCIDAGRAIGSWQVDLFKSHTHDMGQEAGGAADLQTSVSSTGTDESAAGAPTAATGGAETRPRNVAVLFCIRT